MRFVCRKKSLWHRWFAWRPVRIGKYCYWLQTIWRRGIFQGVADCSYWSWEYSLEEEK